MNREGDEGGPDDGAAEGGESETQGGEGATEKDNVIAFPGARVRAVPTTAEGAAATDDEAEGQGVGEAESAAEASAAEAGMTLDAFERAVRSAVREKLGENPEGRPQGADELVAQVFSALTGKDAKTALAEVRQRLAEPLTPGGGNEPADVIDLGAVREARQKASLESAQKIGGALRDTFNQFLANLAERQGMRGEITLDAAFFKQHGTSLLGNLFQGLASALMQQNRPQASGPAATDEGPAARAAGIEGEAGESETVGDADAPTASEAGGEGEAATSEGQDTAKQAGKDTRAVQVKLDLGSILAGLFRRREPPPPSEPTQD